LAQVISAQEILVGLREVRQEKIMKSPMLVALAFLCATVPGVQADSAHPVDSVIKLLKELWNKVEIEGETETKTWMKFKKWCTDSSDTLKDAVQSSTDDIDTLTDSVASKDKERIATEENIEFLEDEIAKYEAEETQAAKDRKDANTLYKAADKDFADTIKAVDEAVKALRTSKKAALVQFLKPEDSRQAEALRQLIQQPLVLEQLSDEQRESLTAAVFGDKPVTEADILAKEKYAKTGQTYTFKSGNVIELLDSLKTHFEDSKAQATNAETAAANDYEVAKDSRKAAVAAAEKSKDGKTTLLGKVKGDLNTARSDLKDEQDELEADSKTLKNTETTCALKASQFADRTKLRKHEMEAMKAAIQILGEVTGVRTSAPKNPSLPTSPVKLLLLQVDDPKMKAVNLLKQEASVSHSKELSRFADELAAKIDGPFDAVNQMVQKMIFRLMDEQKKEDEHKKWCDQELAISEASEKDKDAKEKSLAADIKDAKAHSDELVIKIKDLDAKVAKLVEFMGEATEVRAEGKKENQLAIKDAEAAQAAIAKATAVMETYYKDSGAIKKEEWEFLQDPNAVKLPKQPSSWGSSYTGVADPEKADTGIVAVLKATAADFSKMEADARAQEVTDQEQFDKDMSAAAIDKAKNQKESEMKTDEKKRTNDKVTSLEKKQKHTASELAAVKQYLKDLKPACVNGDSSYEDRKAARDKETEALRKAQGILEDAFKEKSMLQTITKHA